MTSQSTALVPVQEPERPTFAMQQYLAVVASPEAYHAQQQLASAYDAACSALIGPNDVQQEGARSFKKKSAWRKLARHFGISTAVVRVEREHDESGFVATVIVRAKAPWGQSAEAVGACSTDEATGRRVITIADAIATAETRATNRAVSNLIAMGEVSAEEIGERSGAGGAPRAPVSRPPAEERGALSGQPSAPLPATEPACPKCGGRMWDNRATKKNPKAPDFKCRQRSCDGVIWPAKPGQNDAPAAAVEDAPYEDFPPAINDGDDLPF